MTQKPLVLIVAPTADESRIVKGLIDDPSFDIKAICPPSGLPGLLYSLDSALSKAVAIVLSTHAFKNKGVDILSSVKALRNRKPGLTILVYKQATADNFPPEKIIDTGADFVYRHGDYTKAGFPKWVITSISKNITSEEEPIVTVSSIGKPNNDPILEVTEDTTESVTESPLGSLPAVGELPTGKNNDVNQQLLLLLLETSIQLSAGIQAIIASNGKPVANDEPVTTSIEEEEPLEESDTRYQINVIELTARLAKVTLAGRTFKLNLLAARVLEAIVEAKGEFIVPAEIAAKIGGNNQSIYQQILKLKKSLADDSINLVDNIESKHGRGYRYVPE